MDYTTPFNLKFFYKVDFNLEFGGTTTISIYNTIYNIEMVFVQKNSKFENGQLEKEGQQLENGHLGH